MDAKWLEDEKNLKKKIFGYKLLAPNITNYSKWSHQLFLYVQTEIVSSPESNRPSMIDKMIKIAMNCLQLGSYSVPFQIFMGLKQTDRMQATWKNVTTMDLYKILEKLFSPSGNYQEYRSQIVKQKQALPIINLGTFFFSKILVNNNIIIKTSGERFEHGQRGDRKIFAM